VVNSLKPEFNNKITFLIANLDSTEGRYFAEYHNANRVTLLFFNPKGEKVSTLSGELDPQYLRNIFNRVFKL
tara:strand:- start:885 stop:1100 length:216 start_codon:yes stop_codon:yes gene_type:complete